MRNHHPSGHGTHQIARPRRAPRPQLAVARGWSQAFQLCATPCLVRSAVGSYANVLVADDVRLFDVYVRVMNSNPCAEVIAGVERRATADDAGILTAGGPLSSLRRDSLRHILRLTKGDNYGRPRSATSNPICRARRCPSHQRTA